MKKISTSIVLALGTALLLSACNTGIDGNGNDKQETKSFATAKDGAGVLPSWIPEKATDIKEVLRTTGSERIITMKNATLPNSCKAIPAGERPAPADDEESKIKAADYSKGAATLKADWWPEGAEQKASSLCGKWWITIIGESTYAYSPELITVIKNIESSK
ncbi:putative small secreted protein [Arthrobacter sp. UYCu511]|uniref:hypothetical protein n=1 Tax=Arthrobacter sp. UYCu511 TaxID=3156337 RepID=UPI0033984DC8